MEKIHFYFLYLVLVGLYYETSCYGNKTKEGIIIKLFRQKTPREQYLNAPDLRKYGLNFDWLYKKHNNRTNDSIPIYRYLDNEFYGKVVVGHPGQTLNVAFDTAWHLTWLISADCTALRTVGCWLHNKYDHSRSSEYKPNGTKYEENTGKFNFTGYYSYENISIAHSNVTGFSFVEMTKVPFSFLFNKADGVLGLAMRDEEGSYNPFFYTLLQQKKIKKSIFSIYLNRDTQSNHGGNIMLGFYDKKHIHQTRYPNNSVIPDEITYLNVDPGQYWQFDVDSVLITRNKNNNTVLCSKGCKGIIDSSSNTIQGPADQVEKIHYEIKARPFFFNKWMVDCETVNKFPKIDFILGGKTFRLSGKEYTTKISMYAFSLCLSAFSPTTFTDDEQTWVLGGAFLAEFYTVYDINKKQIGFVKAA